MNRKQNICKIIEAYKDVFNPGEEECLTELLESMTDPDLLMLTANVMEISLLMQSIDVGKNETATKMIELTLRKLELKK